MFMTHVHATCPTSAPGLPSSPTSCKQQYHHCCCPHHRPHPTGLDAGDALTHTFHNASSFVTQDARKQSLWILTTQGVGICVAQGCRHNLDADLCQMHIQMLIIRCTIEGLFLTDTPCNNISTHLSRPRWIHSDGGNLQGLFCFPCNCSLALNRLSYSVLDDVRNILQCHCRS